MNDRIYEFELSDTQLFVNMDAFIQAILCLDEGITYQTQLPLKVIGTSLGVETISVELPEYRLHPDLFCNLVETPHFRKSHFVETTQFKKSIKFHVVESYAVMLRIFKEYALRWSSQLYNARCNYDTCTQQGIPPHLDVIHLRAVMAKNIYKKIAQNGWFVNMHYAAPAKKQGMSLFIDKMIICLQEKVQNLCNNTDDLIKEIGLMGKRLHPIDEFSSSVFQDLVTILRRRTGSQTILYHLIHLIKYCEIHKKDWGVKWGLKGVRLQKEKDWKDQGFALREEFYPNKEASVILNCDSLGESPWWNPSSGYTHGISDFMIFLECFEINLTSDIDNFTRNKETLIHALKLLQKCMEICDNEFAVRLKHALSAWTENPPDMCAVVGDIIVEMLTSLPIAKLASYGLAGDPERMDVDDDEESWFFHNRNLIDFCTESMYICKTDRANAFHDDSLMLSLIDRVKTFLPLEWKFGPIPGQTHLSKPPA